MVLLFYMLKSLPPPVQAFQISLEKEDEEKTLIRACMKLYHHELSEIERLVDSSSSLM